MVRSFSNWSQINELFGRGSIIAQDSKSNIRQKMIWRVQDSSSFLVKLIRMPNFLDQNGNLTADAIAFITQNLNQEPEFARHFHPLDANFFKGNFLVYTVVKNTDNRDKVQFKMELRSDFPGLPEGTNYIDSNTVNNYKEKDKEPVVIVPDDDDEDPVIIDDTDKKDEEQRKKEGEKPPVKVGEDEKSPRKFIYLMRTNSIEYTMEFTPDFKKIAAKANKVGGTDGDLQYDQKSDSIPWNADEDAATFLDPLKSDGVITNGYDKSFLKKMFTDSEFRKKVLDEYISKYGDSDITSESIKKMLYHRSGSLIFAEAATPADATGTGETATGANQPNPEKLASDLRNFFGGSGATTQQMQPITPAGQPNISGDVGLNEPQTV